MQEIKREISNGNGALELAVPFGSSLVYIQGSYTKTKYKRKQVCSNALSDLGEAVLNWEFHNEIH